MKNFWIKAVLHALFLSLAGGVFIYAISGGFKISLGAAVGYIIGLFALLLIGLPPREYLKKVRIESLEKRIRRLESYLDLCAEYPGDQQEDGHAPDPHIVKKNKKLDELRQKHYELTNS